MARRAFLPLVYSSTGPSGPWQRCDPRARLLVTTAASSAILAASSWRALGPGLVAVIALHVASRTGPASALASLRSFRFLLLFTIALQLFFTAGEPLLPGLLPGFVTREGAAAAALAVLRLGGVIVASAHLVTTTSPLELARSIGWAITPTARLGVRVREVTLVMALGFQFFPVLIEESRTVRSALESRGISLRHPKLRLRLRALLFWVLAVLFGMVDRSARLATALEAKGFALQTRVRHRFPRWTGGSSVLVAASVALVAAVFLMR